MPAAFTIATFNIRYDNTRDGEDGWMHRRERVRDLIAYHEFDIVGVQEAKSHQADFLAEGPLSYVGVGREDGERVGEIAAVFYNPERFTQHEWGTFWLSETPEKPSRGWDAVCTRVCTWVRLEDTQDGGRDFYIFNTHLDHEGPLAQEKGADLILQRIQTIAGDKPFFLMGDFNLEPSSPTIQKLSKELRNAREVSEAKPYGPKGTFNNFDIQSGLQEPIDYIFLSPQIRVRKFAVLPDNWGQRYASDHLPVVIRAEIQK
jgi:endonuclease/exonuclease/phosphatase family metal-dependent hydrolase